MQGCAQVLESAMLPAAARNMAIVGGLHVRKPMLCLEAPSSAASGW
jgi:hypothetical protein